MRRPDQFGGSGRRSIRVGARSIALVGGLAAAVALAGPTAGVSETYVSGALSRFVGNPSAGAHGMGLAVLTIGGDGTQLSWTITYTGVSSPITKVYFCAGSNPPVYPIGDPCAFVMSLADGGPSPITGSRSIDAQQAAVLSSGSVFIELDSTVGPQLAGYVEPGLPPPNLATVGEPAQGGGVSALVPIMAGIGAFLFVMALGPRRPGVPRTSAARRPADERSSG